LADAAERVCYQVVICYPTSANVSALPGETGTPEIVSYSSLISCWR